MSGLRFGALYDVASYAPVLLRRGRHAGRRYGGHLAARDRYLIEAVAPGVKVRGTGMRYPVTLAA